MTKWPYSYLIGGYNHLKADESGIIRQSADQWNIGKSIHTVLSYYKKMGYTIKEINQ